MTKFATEELNYYFYEEADDKEGFFAVFFGNNESQFMASFIAEFNSEEDASEYVDWKNLQLEMKEGNIIEDTNYNEDDEYVDVEEDLVTLFKRESREFD